MCTAGKAAWPPPGLGSFAEMTDRGVKAPVRSGSLKLSGFCLSGSTMRHLRPLSPSPPPYPFQPSSAGVLSEGRVDRLAPKADRHELYCGFNTY